MGGAAPTDYHATSTHVRKHRLPCLYWDSPVPIGAGIYSGSAAPRGRTQRSPLSGADVSPETHLGFAHKLRMRLWSKYALVPLNQLLAWNSALRVWDLPNGQSMIQIRRRRRLGIRDEREGTELHR